MEGGRRRRVRDLTTFATFHPEVELVQFDQSIHTDHCTVVDQDHWVSPVENAIQDEADDDDTAINTGNETLKWMRMKEHAKKM